MHPYPHVYDVAATAAAQGVVTLTGAGLPALETQPPPQFDGPEGYWSPESLLCAALADCFILTFRGVARASKLEWTRLECQVTGTLERVDGVTRFTRYATRARLVVPPAVDAEKARAALERAEHVCLISNSVNGERTLEAVVEQL
jgi:organic hydroperoxide reductase OsmC/OhrA